ncbi:MAG TPA: DUF1080 domain-containing protein [Verrucomicrobiae bacterium]|nr:DUF1080 domain-containing protein [Verrucomicrobiae bacterium]
MRHCIALALFATLTTAPAAETPRQLFNGKDLTGWEYFLVDAEKKMGDVWSVKDGLLVCKGEPQGYLCTKESFTDFRAVVEWRWAPGAKPGNSGVLLRLPKEDRMLPRCYEAQLMNGSAGDICAFHGLTLAGAADRTKSITGSKLGGDLMVVKKAKAAEKTPGEWNRYEIQFKGDKLTLVINGETVNEVAGCSVMAGRVALQSEGGEVHFRKVEITPLD